MGDASEAMDGERIGTKWETWGVDREAGEAEMINTVHAVKSRKCGDDQDGGVDQVLQRDAGRVAMVPGRWDHEDSRRSDCKDLDTRQDRRSLLGCKASGGFSGLGLKTGVAVFWFRLKTGGAVGGLAGDVAPSRRRLRVEGMA